MLTSTYGAYEQMESSAVYRADPVRANSHKESAKLVDWLPSRDRD